MDRPVVWSNGALKDIDDLAEYISRDSLYYAQHVVSEIMTAGYSLRVQPARGRVVPELDNPAIRELFVYSFRLIYELRETEVVILALIHGKRLLESDERFTA